MHPNIDILDITVSIACKKLNTLQFNIVNNTKELRIKYINIVQIEPETLVMQCPLFMNKIETGVYSITRHLDFSKSTIKFNKIQFVFVTTSEFKVFSNVIDINVML